MLKRCDPLQMFYGIHVHKSHLTQLQIAMGWQEGVGECMNRPSHLFTLVLRASSGKQARNWTA